MRCSDSPDLLENRAVYLDSMYDKLVMLAGSTYVDDILEHKCAHQYR